MNKAFTLAEVLITLGIIGIVAAMTLPGVINNSRSKQLETAFKKNYSSISQALAMYQAETGEPLRANEVGNANLKGILMKYMDVIHECAPAWGSQDCIYNGGDTDVRSKFYRSYNGQDTVTNLNIFDDGQFVLKDGSLILIENAATSNNPVVYISVDVNGYRKSPNRCGHDLFTFQLMNDGKFLPMGAKGTDFENDIVYCNYPSVHGWNGLGCTIKALTDKDYFKNLPR